MHSLSRSRILYLSIAAAGLAAFCGYLASAPAGTFPSWLLVLLNGVNTALAAVTALVRVTMDPEVVAKKAAKKAKP